jgi:hypothetical protein
MEFGEIGESLDAWTSLLACTDDELVPLGNKSIFFSLLCLQAGYPRRVMLKGFHSRAEHPARDSNEALRRFRQRRF